MMPKIIAAIIFILLFSTACVPLKAANVSAPAINCLFDPSCEVRVNDSTSPIPIPAGGSKFLQARTFVGAPGSPASGRYAYQYRIDLSDAVGITSIPCISSMRIKFGPVVGTLDYDGNGSADQVYVVTKGGLGNINLTSAKKNGDEVTFNFNPPVCAGGAPGKGDSTFFIGLVSAQPPSSQPIVATIKEITGTKHSVSTRAPSIEAG